MKIAIVTACPTGIANSLIAAGLLEKAAQDLNLHADIECHSSVTDIVLLSAEQIAQADCIVLATDVNIDDARFIGHKVYRSSIDAVFVDAKKYLSVALKSAEILTKSVELENQDKVSTIKKIVAITACPTGVAHTFMAAEALQQEGERLGYHIKVETRGSVGAKNKLSETDIKEADIVIIAADIDINLAQFDGKKIYQTSTSLALKKTTQTLEKAFTEGALYRHGNTQNGDASASSDKGIYKHLMTGVSHMLPIVVAGGLIIALSFIFGIEAFKEEGTLAAALMTIGGGTAFALMIPVLSGFIAFSIADRPGLAPGLIGGMLASSTGAGFLGGIIAGFLAGYIAKFIADKLKLPQSMQALKPILVIPLFASLSTGLIMIYVVGTPVAFAMTTLTEFLNNMGSANAVILGLILGAMMCFDLGGPVNKTAYTFGVGLLASQTYAPMAAVMAAGMVPALGMGLATFLMKRKFNQSEQEAGKAAFVLGLCFISEGAIPFAARDPMRVIPSCIAGGALTGALSMYFGAQLMAPHGGLFVLFIPHAITPVGLYVFAIIAGTLVTGISYALLKKQDVTPSVSI
ncbi:PTS system, fructose-specific IIBC component [Psychromonas sp. CNPT3]|uniref:PTS fructose transporter subunit IIBC n=1 Tax=Psychromonas sp. CNPT3 TaxID=314282 RepID=UPI00006E9CA0|nr:PTS fructose transporter subunit IIBC [Psychromonas sp. CNPT3]AGH80184.1 PTS system, fructose-specific IIBC component [Psychromonas sp. CNPT3]